MFDFNDHFIFMLLNVGLPLKNVRNAVKTILKLVMLTYGCFHTLFLIVLFISQDIFSFVFQFSASVHKLYSNGIIG